MLKLALAWAYAHCTPKPDTDEVEGGLLGLFLVGFPLPSLHLEIYLLTPLLLANKIYI